MGTYADRASSIFSKPGLPDAVTWLVIGTINHHVLDTCVDPEACDGCCPVCCGPCASLAWWRDEANEDLTRWLNLADPGAGWDWQLPDGSVNWAEIEKHWKPDRIGCVEQH